MKTPFLAIIIGMTAMVRGCKTTTVAPVIATTGNKLSRGARVYIATPADGIYGTQVYEGSGSQVMSALRAAFIPNAGEVSVGGRADLASDAIRAAKQNNCRYAVIPRITQWEDHATEWSGKRDKLELSLRVLRVDNGAEISTTAISGKSSWVTFGGDHPQNLLRGPIEQTVGALY